VPIAVAAGNTHTCAITSDGTVWCWGANAGNQLAVGGDGGITRGQNVLAPEKVALQASAVAIAVGGEHGYQTTPVTSRSPGRMTVSPDEFSCALLSDSTVWCWGLVVERSPYKSPVDDYTTQRPLQISLPIGTVRTGGPRGPTGALTPPTAIAANSGGACALFSSEGSVWCWTLGVQIEDLPFYPPATHVAGLPPATSIAAGGNTTCATVQDGTVWCWKAGQAPTQQVNPSDAGTPGPYLVEQTDAGASGPRLAVGINIAALQYCNGERFGSAGACVADARCIVSASNQIECWLGDPPPSECSPSCATPAVCCDGQCIYNEACGPLSYLHGAPFLITQGTGLSAGEGACAIAPDGELFCWPSLGESYGEPAFEPELQDVITVSAGANHVCAIAADSLWCWGDNGYGQLGNGTFVGGDNPTLVIPSWSNGLRIETDASSGSGDDASDGGDDGGAEDATVEGEDGAAGDATVGEDAGHEAGHDASADASSTDAGQQCQDAGETPGAHGEPVTVSAGASCVLPAAITSNTDLSPTQCAVYGAPNGIIVGSPTGAAPTLTIEAGTTIAFGPGTNLIVGAETSGWPNRGPGALQVNGTQCQPVVFTASGIPNPGGWGGVTFQQATAPSTVKNLVVQYGGGGGQYIVSGELGSVSSLRLDGFGISGTPADFTVVLQDVTLSNNASGGFAFQGKHTGPGPGSGTLTVTDWPPGYASDPYLIDPDAVGLLTNVSLSTAQAGAYVHVAEPYTHGGEEIDSSETWPSIPIPYVLGLSSEPTDPGDNTLQVVAGAASNTLWTIAAPNTLQFANGFRIDIRTPGGAGPSGAILANGTSGAPIVFEGLGGVPQPGTWQGINFPDGVYFTPSSITYARIDSAGGVAGSSIDPLSAINAGSVCNSCGCVTGPTIANVTFSNLPTTSYAICATGAAQLTANEYAADNTFPSANAVYTLTALDAGTWHCGQ
jgi:hypothetical protein